MVFTESRSRISPDRSDSGSDAAPSACTPITRASGTRPVTAVATPAISPPPPTGTTTVSTSGHSSTISSPIVPWPAITASSSNA